MHEQRLVVSDKVEIRLFSNCNTTLQVFNVQRTTIEHKCLVCKQRILTLFVDYFICTKQQVFLYNDVVGFETTSVIVFAFVHYDRERTVQL